MKHTILFSIILIAPYFVFTQSHLESGSTYDDPYNFMFTFNSGLRGMQMFQNGLNLDGRPSVNLLYAKFSTEEIESIYSSVGHTKILDTYDINVSNKEIYKDFFKNKGDIDIPKEVASGNKIDFLSIEKVPYSKSLYATATSSFLFIS